MRTAVRTATMSLRGVRTWNLERDEIRTALERSAEAFHCTRLYLWPLNARELDSPARLATTDSQRVRLRNTDNESQRAFVSFRFVSSRPHSFVLHKVKEPVPSRLLSLLSKYARLRRASGRIATAEEMIISEDYYCRSRFDDDDRENH